MSSYLPPYYDESKCGTLFTPNLNRAAEAGREFARKERVVAAPRKPNTIFTIIDNQVDFVCGPRKNPDGSAGTAQPGQVVGSLFVPGAVEDSDRINRFIYSNVGQIDHIIASLDTHFLYQPFHPFNWIAGPHNPSCKEGTHPPPFTIITFEQLRNNVWLPTRNLVRMGEMLDTLETTGKKNLCIWPLHCILGTPGHALDPTLMEALYFHAAARQNQYSLTEKGTSPSCEHYGILHAEVQFDDDTTTHMNVGMLNKWEHAETIYFAGQAASHCVVETLKQIVTIFKAKSPKVLERLHILEDCTSPVPDIKDESGATIVPFAEMTRQAFAEFKNEGVKFVKSTDAI